MKDRKKVLNDLIINFGLEKASKMTGLSKFDLINRSECYIDLSMVNDIIGDLIKENVIPKTYKNCRLSYDGFGGTLDWWCDWSDDEYNDYKSEETYSLATPFWDITDGIPVATNSQDALGDDDKISFTEGDLSDNQCYSWIKWGEEFNNLASYSMWIRRFYLPNVYDKILQHLNNYRNHVENYG